MNSPKSKSGKSAKPRKTPKATAGRKPAPSRGSKTKPTKPVLPSQTAYPALLKKVVQALDEKKAERLVVLNVSRLSSITDYLVVGTATSDPHLRALRVELEKVIDADQTKILGIDTTQGSGWTVVDAFDVMVHLFTSENREKYRLENLWKDAEPVDLTRLT
jgi:ribosome-associated protein